jgi:hypothetical protein
VNTLRGDPHLPADVKLTFRISAIEGSDRTCYTTDGGAVFGAPCEAHGAEPAPSPPDIKVTSATLNKGNRIEGKVKNEGSMFPFAAVVGAGCFSRSGQYLGEAHTSTNEHAIGAGETGTFSIDLGSQSCPAFLVGVGSVSE